MKPIKPYWLPELPKHDGSFASDTPEGARLDQSEIDGLDQLTAKPVEWLWPGRFPIGKVTLVVGPAGCGKSLMTQDLAARASRGGPWPVQTDVARLPHSVLIISRQDHQEDTILPRIERAGGNLGHILIFQRLHTSNYGSKWRHRNLVLPYDLPMLDYTFGGDVLPKLAIFDPISDFCTDPKHLAEVIQSLSVMAEAYSIAIVATLPGSARQDARGQWQVKSRWPDQAARCVWFIADDPDEPGRRLFLPSRMNFCEVPRGMAFRIKEGMVTWEELPETAAEKASRESDEARWLNDVLREEEMPATALLRQGRECGFTEKKLRQAARKLGVKMRRIGFGAEGRSCWSLEGARRIGAVVNGAQSGSHLLVDDAAESDCPHPTRLSSPKSGPLPVGEGDERAECAELELVGSGEAVSV